MADRLADKAAFLDNRIMDFARAFEEAEGSVCSTPVHQAMQVEDPPAVVVTHRSGLSAKRVSALG